MKKTQATNPDALVEAVLSQYGRSLSSHQFVYDAQSYTGVSLWLELCGEDEAERIQVPASWVNWPAPCA